MSNSENIIKFEEKLKNNEESKKKYEATLKRILDEKSAKSDGEAVQKAAKEIGFDLSKEEIERAFAAKQEMPDDELDKVAGGWCVFDHSCYLAACHDKEVSEKDACAWDYICFSISKESDSEDCSPRVF